MVGAVVGIILVIMEVCSVPGTAKAFTEVGEGDTLAVLGIPTDFPSSLAAGSADEAAPRLLEAGWVLLCTETRFVGSGSAAERDAVDSGKLIGLAAFLVLVVRAIAAAVGRVVRGMLSELSCSEVATSEVCTLLTGARPVVLGPGPSPSHAVS